ncbi:MAG: hypothetical protein ACE5NG_19665, partial [bacterium]
AFPGDGMALKDFFFVLHRCFASNLDREVQFFWKVNVYVRALAIRDLGKESKYYVCSFSKFSNCSKTTRKSSTGWPLSGDSTILPSIVW